MFTPDPTAQAWLETFLREHGGAAGTMHRREGETLRLVAAQNIPPPVLAATAEIPFGKGMAGLAWERRQPVQTCNLQNDRSRDVRPGARAVSAHAAVALPVFDAAVEVRGVVGIAYAQEGEIPPAQTHQLAAAAAAAPVVMPA